MYITKQLKLPVSYNPTLTLLSHETGNVYSKSLTTFKRILRKKNLWLSANSMQKLIKNNNLHSQTTQGTIQKFYDNIKSWRKRRKSDPNARLPKKRKYYFEILYKESAIKLKDNNLILSNGKGNDSIVIPWKFEKPAQVKINWNGKSHVLNAIYEIPDLECAGGNNIAGIDIGEVHMAVAHTDKECIILNGRKLRAYRHYQNKIKASFQKRMSTLKKGSRKYKKIKKAKERTLTKLNNQIKDVLQKQTAKLVSTLKEKNVQTVVIGDITNIRDSIDYGKKANQKLHQWAFGQITFLLKYKFAMKGILMKFETEEYTSQTCPICNHRHKPNNRNYKCKCGFRYHRDGVGSWNIRAKYIKKYMGDTPVFGEMATPIGIRY